MPNQLTWNNESGIYRLSLSRNIKLSAYFHRTRKYPEHTFYVLELEKGEKTLGTLHFLPGNGKIETNGDVSAIRGRYDYIKSATGLPEKVGRIFKMMLDSLEEGEIL